MKPHNISALLLSSSRYKDTEYLEHALEDVKAFLGPGIDHILFIPFAGVSISHDDYELLLAETLAPIGFGVRSIHKEQNKLQAVRGAKAIAVGGGNTFALLKQLQELNLIQPIRDAVHAGTPYIGWSAGSNVAGPSIKTTNDMPICQPASFDALSLIPFQINPHFISGKVQGHNGESREERIAEYLAYNPGEGVLALPEGTRLERQGDRLTIKGSADAILFLQEEARSIPCGSDLSSMLN